MRDDGFIMLQRKFFSHDFWGEKRKFSRAEAFVDLIRSANFAPKRVLVGNAYIELERGQQIASLRFLGQRWGWSTFKVKSFLKLLFEEKMAYTKTKHQQTILTLCNYDTYNTPPNENQTQTKHEHNTNQTKHNKGNKEKKNNMSAEADAEALWPLFPKTSRTRSSKASLIKALAKHKDRPETSKLVESAKQWSNCHEWKKDNGQFAPAAHRWANEKRWENAPEQTTQKQNGINTRPLFD